jgi:hypothetical protein
MRLSEYDGSTFFRPSQGCAAGVFLEPNGPTQRFTAVDTQTIEEPSKPISERLWSASVSDSLAVLAALGVL